MDFWDCNVSYGTAVDIADADMLPVPSIEKLQAEIAGAGIARAIVWRKEQFTGGMVSANRLLAEDLQGQENLLGTWAILPTPTHEMPGPGEMPRIMRENRIIGWRLFPDRGRFLPRAFVLRDWLQEARARRIPVFVNTSHGTRLEDLHELMQAFPDLVVVLTFAHDWPSDRHVRPFVREYENLYVDLTYCITDGGIESFVEEHGSGRLLYGSGFPRCYFGGNMLMVRHAGVPEADRVAIAGGNMQRIVEEVDLD